MLKSIGLSLLQRKRSPYTKGDSVLLSQKVAEVRAKSYLCMMKNVYRDIKQILAEGGIASGEAQAIAMLLMEKVAGMTTAEVLMNDPKGEEHRATLLSCATRIAKGEPVQYVVGEADFCGLTFKVPPGVLIPRPETEELVNWVREEAKEMEGSKEGKLALLDIGTGSGCIAISLAHLLKDTEVEAWDISEEALLVARENAKRNHVGVVFKKRNALEGISKASRRHLEGESGCIFEESQRMFDIIVSNPPYICESEKKNMGRNVLEHEPGLALFVPDNDPLLFYRKIAEMGRTSLREGGRLFFEINRQYGMETLEMLGEMGYQEVELRKDQFGDDRMGRAIKA